MILTCTRCEGEGSIYSSRYGGNDPDVWRVGPCEDCGGSGNMVCEARGCNENAVAFNEDGEALCEDCIFEWALSSAVLGGRGMSRCDLSTLGECSCSASAVPCKVQSPVYRILEEANTGAAKHGSACLILLSIIVFAIIIGAGAQIAPAAI